jgi:hypothetical protein
MVYRYHGLTRPRPPQDLSPTLRTLPYTLLIQLSTCFLKNVENIKELRGKNANKRKAMCQSSLDFGSA